MVALTTPAVDNNFSAPDFALKGTDGKIYSLNDVKGENGLLVMFICNHCPYVKAVLDKIIRDAKELQAKGVGVVAVMSNDVEEYPDDSFENMQKLAREKNFSFPYVIDETQSVAKLYDAVCTPDFFGFNADLKLQYRGRLDSSGRSNDPDAKRELFEAMLQVAQTGNGPIEQAPSIGCNIKWKE